MNGIIPGSAISTFKTISLSLGKATKANRDGKISEYIVIGMKNKKSLLGKKQNVILFDDDLSPEIFTVLKRYSTPSTDHAGSFDVNLAKFKASSDFASDPETWGQLLEFPGGCFEEYEFAKGACYANDVSGTQSLDGNQQPIIRSSVAVFVQIDFIDAQGITHYIEPYSKNAQGARIESRFFRNAVEGNSTPSNAFDPASVMAPPVQPTQQSTTAIPQPTAPQQSAAQPTANPLPY